MIEACKCKGMECAPLSSIIITTTNHNSIRLKTIPTTCSMNMLLVTSDLGKRRLHFPRNWRCLLWFIYIEILLLPCLIIAHWKSSENLHVCCLNCNRNVYYYMKVLFSAQFTIYSSGIFNKKKYAQHQHNTHQRRSEKWQNITSLLVSSPYPLQLVYETSSTPQKDG